MTQLCSLLIAPLTAVLVLAGAYSFQEPQPAPPPPRPESGQAPAPGALQPPPGAPARHPLAGVYELRRRVVDGLAETRPSRGYLAITNRHMFLCLAGPGTDDNKPLLRAGVRTWAQRGDAIESIVKIGYYTDAEGGIHVEPPATAEKRRISMERGLLRIHQDGRNLLEFERVE